MRNRNYPKLWRRKKKPLPPDPAVAADPAQAVAPEKPLPPEPAPKKQAARPRGKGGRGR